MKFSLKNKALGLSNIDFIDKIESYKRIHIFFFGLALLFTLFTDFFFSLNQPYQNLGFNFTFSDTSFNISRVAPNSQAEKAGISSSDKYIYVNDTSIIDIGHLRQNEGQEKFKQRMSRFFEFGQTVSLTNTNGKKISFVLEKQPLLTQLTTIDFYLLIKYLIAALMIITGIFASISLITDTTVKPLIYSLYFLGITCANIFDLDLSSPVYSVVSAVLMDFGLAFTLSSVFSYFSKIFTYTRYPNIFKYFRFLPASMFAFKYLCIVLFKWSINNNTFNNINTAIVIGCCLLFILVFIFVIIAFPKSLTLTFKLFIFGLVFATAPILIEHFTFIMSNGIFMTQRDKIYTTVPFIFLPVMLIIAMLYNRHIIRSKTVFWITSYLAFGTFTVPIFITFMEYTFSMSLFDFALFYVLLSPFAFSAIRRVVIKFFSLDTDENRKILDKYRNLISPISDTTLLHVVTTQEIRKLINCSYAFYYKKEADKWVNLYTWGDIDDVTKEIKLHESYTKRHLEYYKDGSFSVPILRNNHTSGVVYIGPKENSEHYLPGECLLIEQIIGIFHSHYLMYTNNFLLSELKKKHKKLAEIQEGTILSMANLIESRDGGTGAHVKRTAEYSVLISKRAKEKGLFPDIINDTFIDLLYKAAPMHDIGKIVVSDSILKKPDKLTSEEFEQMKRHTTEGERIVKEVLSSSEEKDYITMTSQIAMFHHEKWNGQGYPSGLKEEAIPLCARILAIADVFDALVSPRCYKEPMPPQKAFEIIEKDAGTHFDPVLAKVFLELKDEALEIMKHEYL